MLKSLAPVLLLLAGATDVQPIAPGRWAVISVAVAIEVPGVPGFMLRMMKGRSKTEYKCIAPEQSALGVAALLAPDPKANCRVESIQIADGRYTQAIACPQKQGQPLHIERTGHYDATGFSGRLHLAGATAKGAMSITLDQHASRTSATCTR